MTNVQEKNIADLLNIAQKRSDEGHFSYAGAVKPSEAFDLLQADTEVHLVDVRTKAELELVGRVPNAIHVEWATYPGMVANADFAKQLQEQLDQHGIDKSSMLIFMCRTGGRSHNAATVAATLGYTQALNMLEGFEGEANQFKQRALINGWKQAGLPWTN